MPLERLRGKNKQQNKQKQKNSECAIKEEKKKLKY